MTNSTGSTGSTGGTDRAEHIGGTTVLFCAAEGPLLRGTQDALDLIGAASGAGAAWAAVPAGRLHEDFFRLRTGVAGEVAQKFAQYGVGLAVVGDIGTHTAASDALRDLVREGNRGNALWFVTDPDELRARLSPAAGDRARS
ncbi:DUF4180 domain-containing protein [Streptomyces sp. TRM 70361]|uniref:DUF4180 domain-containing protein n=1 Tax=Streptomyces sp. TRM 70361 TaxID=3116553 RepID=UPI002E7BF18A|nr:DUF4180 domain-containing protein [Streptomyces sp. TRM 70361]MEE1942311.1 DUF4180 domain-containing protein [Streptomyces sp. TRM 70361]